MVEKTVRSFFLFFLLLDDLNLFLFFCFFFLGYFYSRVFFLLYNRDTVVLTFCGDFLSRGLDRENHKGCGKDRN